jgi:putative transposase
MCQTLGVSASGYYAWRERQQSARRQSDQALTQRIKQVHSDSDGTYGMPRIRRQLCAEGVRVSRKRVARLMKAESVRGVTRRRYVVTTHRDERQRRSPDLVKRKFNAQGPDELWVADITFVPTGEGFLYLATVLDVFSRKVVGWSMADEMPVDLVLSALNMALQTRRPKAVIHHSDQGSQYTSMAFRNRCEKAGVRLSMGSVGDAYDNAMAESFFATLECELIARRNWKTRSEAKTALFCWIEGWYNPRRLHSGVDYLSPNQFEQKHIDQRRRRRSGFPTAALGSSQAPTAAVENPAPVVIQR